jgi:tetratricopeptide (TPR) repeat protein
LNLDADVPISTGILSHGALFGLLGLLALSAAAWIYRRRLPAASYGWFVFLLLIAPTSSFVPIADPYAERRLYMPFIGLTLIVVDFLRRWKISRGALVAACGAILLFEGALAYQRNLLWGDPVAMWKDTTEKSPQKVRPAWQYALSLTEAGRCADASKEYSRAASLRPPEYGLIIDWALAADCAGDGNQALQKFQQAAAMQPSAHAFSQVGMEYAKQGKWAQAMDALNRSLQFDPKYVKSYIYRGGVYESQGDFANAANEYRQALSIDPNNQEAQQALARVGSRLASPAAR